MRLRSKESPFSAWHVGKLIAVLAALIGIALAADGAWREKVPPRDHDRVNPYHGQPDAIAAGRKLFLDHCAECHGENAEGTKKRPSLRSDRVQQQVTEGDIHWLLTNGNMKKGMPSWAKLPDLQRWQVITYVKSLQDATPQSTSGTTQ